MNCKCRCGCPIWVSEKSGQLMCQDCEGRNVFGKQLAPKHTNDYQDPRPYIQAFREVKAEPEEVREPVVRGRWNNDPPRGWQSLKQREKAADNRMADELRRRA